MTEQEAWAVFLEVHNDIPRGGPGDFESTRRALAMLTDLPAESRILDIGCGPGRQTLDLAGLTAGEIVAIDTHQYFLDRLSAEIAKKDLTPRVKVLNRDMGTLDFEPESFDLVWAEGSAYIMGFEKALRAWKPLLRGPGYIAVTELTWLKPDPPEEPRSFFTAEYPPMQDLPGNLALVEQAGYTSLGHFALPDSAWWDHYYTPIEKILPRLKEKYSGNPVAMQVIESEEKEIDMHRRYAEYYGYVFYVMRRAC